MLFDQHQPARSSAGKELNLLPPPELNVPLWRSLLANLRDRFSPDRLPPLQLTSRPIRVGMLVGDILDVPWYRTILSNIGDLLSPDTLPPLQLESQPVDVELISDMPGWWRSLLRNLADAAAPEKLPALRLTSSPVDPEMASKVLVVPRWSSLIAASRLETPKIPRPDPLIASLDLSQPAAVPLRTILLQLPPLEAHAVDDFEYRLALQLQRSIRRSHIREFAWLSVIVAEVIAVVFLRLLPH
jgi:hypothetical protein